MQNKDIFAAVAETKVILRKDLMQSINPNKITAPQVEGCVHTRENACNIDIKDLSNDYGNDIINFHKGINDLKVKYSEYTKRRNTPVLQRDKLHFSEFDFRFETKDDISDFSNVLLRKGDWERVTIPHYHGPTGKWVSYYRRIFDYDKNQQNIHSYMVFKGSDYITDVYLNQRHVLSHEGFFASFEADVTEYLKDKNNVLVIKVENDITALGENNVFGTKLYAATGIGWDEPGSGWHHCPAGGEIFDAVYIEKRNVAHVYDAYVRSDIDKGIATVYIEIKYAKPGTTNCKLNIIIEPFNFESDFTVKREYEVFVNNGINSFSYEIPIQNMRLWNCDTPYLYTIKISVDDMDFYELNFGMRKFHMDRRMKPYGTLYLNNDKVFLRGANEMGHLQLNVIKNDYDSLINDILIAKYANMNYYRITQRPVQRQIYEYCDMLGIMVQVDFPLFGQLPKSQFYEATGQAGEMERHIRRHASVIMISYINEPTDQNKNNGINYNLDRQQLENWFDICDRVIKHENPDRVIKRVEGDYDPPTSDGLSDFHCYNMWYTNHALPIGDLYKGYLPAIKKDWKTGCGEYGTEGLDNLELMKSLYPKSWLPNTDTELWTPDRIPKSQTNSMHGDWFYEQTNIADWIRFSQNHQTKATNLMTLALRRRSDYIVSTALHLLIDAYPAGWMKTVVGVDRVPKPSYFAFKRSLEPVKINLRCDRWSCYSDETLLIETWILNDLPKTHKNLHIKAYVGDEKGVVYTTYDFKVDAKESESACVAQIKLDLNNIPCNDREDIKVYAILYDKDIKISEDLFDLTVYKRPDVHIHVSAYGKVAHDVLKSCPYFTESNLSQSKVVIISDIRYDSMDHVFRKLQDDKDKTVMYVMSTDMDKIKIGKNSYGISDRRMWKATYSPLNIGLLKGFRWNDLSFLYDRYDDEISFTVEYFIECDNPGDVYVFNYEKPLFTESVSGKKLKRPVLLKNRDGIFTTLNLYGKTGVNPALDRLLYETVKGDL